jgi:hypothetical protein
MHFAKSWNSQKHVEGLSMGTLEDLDEANVLEPNNAFILQSCGIVKNMFKDYQGEPWRTLMRLMFLNQTMHSLCKAMELSKTC